jgi:uncharacterized protein (TIGR02452 family)
MAIQALQARAFQNLARASTELCAAQLTMMSELEKDKSHADIDIYGGILEAIDRRMINVSGYLTDMPEDEIKSSDEVKTLFKRVAAQYNETAERINALATKAKGARVNIFPILDFSFKLEPERVHQLRGKAPVSDVFQYPQVTSLAQRQIASFKIEPASSSTFPAQKTTSLLEKLHSISQIFRSANESAAMQEFSNLEESTKQKIYELLWIIRGRRLDFPGDFGKHSFIGDADAIKSTPQQKACAIELFILQESTKLVIQTMLEELKNSNPSAMKEIFNTLPLQVQGEIFGLHWKVCGEPTDKSSDEKLRKMAHGDFGKVSFLDLESRCSVPLSKKIETLETYLKNLSSFTDERFKLVEQLVKGEAEAWKKIDQSNMKGQEKNEAKKAALFPFANKLVRLFTPMGHNQDVAVIPILSKSDGTEIKRFEAYAAEYAKKYPCLKPFVLQLAEKLDLQDKTQQLILPVVPYDSPKPLQVSVPDFSQMTPPQRKIYLTDIMNDTLTTLKKGYYINSRGEKVSLDLKPAAQSVYPFSNDGGKKVRSGSYQTSLYLAYVDCLRIAQNCAERKLNPIVVDAASEGHFGGGYLDGAAAQEENLCRRTGLSFAVNPLHQVQQQDFYPLTRHGDHAVLHVENVPVIRGEESKGYPYLDQPFDTAFAIVAAENFNLEHQRKKGIQNPKQLLTDTEGRLYMPPDSADRTKKKLRTVLEMAALNNHKSLVMVALGCGAFQNPPAQVCEMLMQLITEEFPHSFQEIHISIIEDHNSKKRHNPRGNFVEFQEVIEKQFIGKLQNAGIRFQIFN